LKNILFLSLFFCAQSQAQSLTYEIEVIKEDSVYLVSREVSSVTPEQPRAQVTTGYTLFKSENDISIFVEKVKKKAKEDEDAAQKQYDTAQQMKAIAAKIEAAIIAKVAAVPKQ